MNSRTRARSAVGRLPLLAAVMVALASVIANVSGSVAAPAGPVVDVVERRSVPGWMSNETAQSLNPGFDVLLPVEVPAPLAGEPSITAYDGFYSLYWLIPGAPPTFLEITGTAGGVIPDYSKYDRNIQLSQNATVGGWPAYHDLTPIYDLVYWDAGGVVYAVESQNLTATDSLSLANSLVVLQQPADEPSTPSAEITVPESVAAGDVAVISVSSQGVTVSADAGQFTVSGGAIVGDVNSDDLEWIAPAVASDTWITFYLTDPATEVTIATASLLVVASPDKAQIGLECPDSAIAGSTVSLLLTGSGDVILDATGGAFPASERNSLFGANDGGATLVGSLGDGASATIEWIAPDVDEAATFYVFASTLDGQTPGECAVVVDGSVIAARAVGDPAGSNPEVAEQESDESVDGGVSSGEPDVQAAEPTATATPKPRRRNDDGEYNEVLGLPTAITAEPGPGDGTNILPSTPGATQTASARPTATLAPTIGQEGMVASVIGPGGGVLTNPEGATVDIPGGALDREATLSIIPVADTKLPQLTSVVLVPGTGFDIALASEDGRAISELAAPAIVRIEVGAERIRDGARIYRISGSTLEALESSQIDGTAVVARTSAFSRLVVGIPAQTTASESRSVVPLIVGVIAILVFMVAGAVVLGMLRPRRARSVGVRRNPPRSRYR